MNGPPNDELISAYLDDELDAAERERVEQALREDAQLRRMLEQFTALRTTLQALPKAKPDERFADWVLRRAEREMLGGPAAATPVVPTNRNVVTGRTKSGANWRRLGWIVATVAAVSLVVVMLYPFGRVRPVASAPKHASAPAATESEPATELARPALPQEKPEQPASEGRAAKSGTSRGAAANETPASEKKRSGSVTVPARSPSKKSATAFSMDATVRKAPAAADRAASGRPLPMGGVGSVATKAMPSTAPGGAGTVPAPQPALPRKAEAGVHAKRMLASPKSAATKSKPVENKPDKSKSVRNADTVVAKSAVKRDAGTKRRQTDYDAESARRLAEALQEQHVLLVRVKASPQREQPKSEADVTKIVYRLEKSLKDSGIQVAIYGLNEKKEKESLNRGVGGMSAAKASTSKASGPVVLASGTRRQVLHAVEQLQKRLQIKLAVIEHPHQRRAFLEMLNQEVRKQIAKVLPTETGSIEKKLLRSSEDIARNLSPPDKLPGFGLGLRSAIPSNIPQHAVPHPQKKNDAEQSAQVYIVFQID